MSDSEQESYFHSSNPNHIRAFFLPGKHGKLFSIYRMPDPSIPVKKYFLIIPPFAEEMNKSRRMLRMLMEELAVAGCASLLIDLYGTGDSEGEFDQASWNCWLDDIYVALKYLSENGADSIDIIGLRIGALIATDFLESEYQQKIHGSESPVYRINQLLFWQPVLNGSNFLTQFMRLRVAASMLSGDENKETTTQLRQQFAEGNAVEIAGYLMSAHLANDLQSLDYSKANLIKCPHVNWFEITSDLNRGMSAASQRIIDRWNNSGATVSSMLIQGDTFWSTVELADVPELISKTVETISNQ